MGLSMVGSFCPHVLARKSSHFGPLTGKILINYNFTVTKFRTCPGRALVCRREFVDFEERSSPDEVSSVFSLIKATIFVLLYSFVCLLSI